MGNDISELHSPIEEPIQTNKQTLRQKKSNTICVTNFFCFSYEIKTIHQSINLSLHISHYTDYDNTMKDNRLLYPKTKIDWGPGENHICLKTPFKNFYVIELFHQAPTFDKTIPLFISDINNSPNLYGIYNYIADHLRHVVLVNNYPVNQINIFGKIVYEQYKEKEFNGVEESYVILVISDFIGIDSKIRVRLSQEQFKEVGLTLDKKNYGKIVELEGEIYNWYDSINVSKKPDRELKVSKITVLSHRPDGLHFEFEQWKKRMEFRKNNLVEPWVFIPTPQRENRIIDYKFTEDDTKKKQQQRDLDLGVYSLKEIDNVPVEEDSLLVHAIHKSDSRIKQDLPSPSSNKLSLVKSVDRIHTQRYIKPTDLEDTPLKVVTDFQLTTEIIKFIIKKGFVKVKLLDIYRDPRISELLTNYANLQLVTLEAIPKFKNLSFKDYKLIIFHRQRHKLQKNLQLITISKTQLVRLVCLKNLYSSVLKILKSLKNSKTTSPFNVMDYLDMLKNKKLLLGDINYKLMNYIIEYILENVLFDDDNWHYDTNSISWSYIAPG